MTDRARIFLALTIIGFVVPNAMVAAFIADNGLEIGHYFSDWVANLPATQILVDLLIVGAAFLVWAAYEGPRAGIRRWWVIFPASALVGLCFGVPLFLYMRERALGQ